MQQKFLALLAGTALATGITTLISAPSYASVSFRCEMQGGLPTTVAYNSRGNQLNVIKWYSEYFTGSGYDPVTRCQQVSGRFQSAYYSGRINYITAGIVNGMPVVCATTPGGRCDGSNVLFTLKQGTNAANTLQHLFDIRGGYASSPLFENDGRTYVDVQKLLAPLESEESGTPSVTPAEPTQPAQPAPAPAPGGWGR